MTGLFLTGTDTDVGKTVVAAILVAGLRARGVPATYRKPIGCGGRRLGERVVSGDAFFVRRAAGLLEPPAALNPICLATPAGPTVALRRERVALSRAAVRRGARPAAGGIAVVEGVGGLLVPILRGWSNADLAGDLRLPIVVVARARIGTINHSLLTIEAARRRGLRVLGLVVSGMPRRPSPAEAGAPGEIAREGRTPILGIVPRLPRAAFRGPGPLLRAAGGFLEWDAIYPFVRPKRRRFTLR